MYLLSKCVYLFNIKKLKQWTLTLRNKNDSLEKNISNSKLKEMYGKMKPGLQILEYIIGSLLHSLHPAQPRLAAAHGFC